MAERREHLLKIGVSGVRGVIGEFLTPAVAAHEWLTEHGFLDRPRPTNTSSSRRKSRR